MPMLVVCTAEAGGNLSSELQKSRCEINLSVLRVLMRELA